MPGLHWKAFDPFPAFVAYLLISNVIQILLMPLIMVGQNVQGRHTEIRAELDYEVNQKAEKEVIAVMRHLEHNTDLILSLMQHLKCHIPPEELKALTAEHEQAQKLENGDGKNDGCRIKTRRKNAMPATFLSAFVWEETAENFM